MSENPAGRNIIHLSIPSSIQITMSLLTLKCCF